MLDAGCWMLDVERSEIPKEAGLDFKSIYVSLRWINYGAHQNSSSLDLPSPSND